MYFFGCGKYKTPEMFDMFILENNGILKFISDYCKDQKCVVKLLTVILLQYIFFLNAIRFKKWVMKLLIVVYKMGVLVNFGHGVLADFGPKESDK